MTDQTKDRAAEMAELNAVNGQVDVSVAAVREADAVLIEDAIRVLRIPDVPRYEGDDGPVVKRTALGLADAIRSQDPNHASAIAEIERRAIERLECCCFELQSGQITVDETLACPRCEALMEKEGEG